ncbi:MAG: rod shape-determining protein MreC [Clostridiales bacterium]|jgi:rod shape-determining protein MreC|nr:rod shape-determining protein MreC [Clostridiales bacterium]
MEFINKYKRMLIIAVILLCIALMAYSAYYRSQPGVAEDILSYAVTPFQSAVKSVQGWFSNTSAYFRNLGETAAENEKLTKELDALKIENSRLKNVERQYSELAQLFEMSETYTSYPTVGVTVIGKDPGNWYDNFIIDKGRKDGLDANMVVLGVGGIVGRIMESGYNYSKVSTLMDDTFAVSAQSARTQDIGTVKGDMSLKNDGLCKMERIDINADIIAGDEIVTSNLGNIYPPGITIGFVREVTANPDALTKTATITPAVDFEHLNTLLVINEVFTKELTEWQGEEE